MVDVLFLSLLLFVLDHIIVINEGIIIFTFMHTYIHAYISQVYITTVDVSI